MKLPSIIQDLAGGIKVEWSATASNDPQRSKKAQQLCRLALMRTYVIAIAYFTALKLGWGSSLTFFSTLFISVPAATIFLGTHIIKIGLTLAHIAIINKTSEVFSIFFISLTINSQAGVALLSAMSLGLGVFYLYAPTKNQGYLEERMALYQ